MFREKVFQLEALIDFYDSHTKINRKKGDRFGTDKRRKNQLTKEVNGKIAAKVVE